MCNSIQSQIIKQTNLLLPVECRFWTFQSVPSFWQQDGEGSIENVGVRLYSMLLIFSGGDWPVALICPVTTSHLDDQKKACKKFVPHYAVSQSLQHNGS